MKASKLAREAIQRLHQKVVSPLITNERKGKLSDDKRSKIEQRKLCLLYTSDAADE